MPVKSVYITHTSHFLPNEPVSNDNMELLLGQVGARPSRAKKMVLRSNQIKSRYYAIDPVTGEHNYSNAALCAEAVKGLAHDDFSVANMTCMAAATSIPDQVMPGHASMVHGELGSPVCEVATTSGVCASGMSALKYAYMNVAAGLHEQAVAAASEAPSYVLRAENFVPEIEKKLADLEQQPEIAFEKDFLRWMLSDGAGAVLLQDSPNKEGLSLKVEWLDMFSYAGEMTTCMYTGARKNADGTVTGWPAVTGATREAESFMSIKQDVKQLNEHIIHFTAEKPLQALMEKYQLQASDIDYFLPHYSSHYFRDRLYAGMCKVGFDVPQDKWFTNLYEKGNTGAASMYIMLDDLMRSGKLQKGEKILCYIPESGRFSVAYMLLEVV